MNYREWAQELLRVHIDYSCPCAKKMEDAGRSANRQIHTVKDHLLNGYHTPDHISLLTGANYDIAAMLVAAEEMREINAQLRQQLEECHDFIKALMKDYPLEEA